MPPSDRYTRTAIALHWIVAALVIAQFAWGWWMQGIPKQPVGPRVDAFNLHKSMGLLILGLMLLRLGWRLGHPAPALPDMPRWQARLAHGSHAVLYAVLIVMPLAGYLGSAFSGYPVRYFGLAIPAWTGKHPEAKELMSLVHAGASWVLAGAVLLHLAGALKHALIERDGVLARMGIGRAPRPIRAERAIPTPSA